MIRSSLMLAALLLGGCATSYVDVPIEEPHATITFQRNKEGVKAVNNEPFQGYDLLESPQCESFQRITGFSFDGVYQDRSFSSWQASPFRNALSAESKHLWPVVLVLPWLYARKWARLRCNARGVYSCGV